MTFRVSRVRCPFIVSLFAAPLSSCGLTGPQPRTHSNFRNLHRVPDRASFPERKCELSMAGAASGLFLLYGNSSGHFSEDGRSISLKVRALGILLHGRKL